LLKFIARLTTIVVFSLAAFSARSATAQSNANLKIGFSIEAMNGERWQTDLASFESRAKQLGADVISADAHGDDERQLQQVQDMIKSGIKALVLLPHDTSKAGRIVEAAKAARVKVISYDRLVFNSDVDLFISFDGVAIGTMQAEYLVKRAPKGNYVLIAGSPNDEGAKTLRDAQTKVLRPTSPCSRQSIPVKGISPPCLLPMMVWPEAQFRPCGSTVSPAKFLSRDKMQTWQL
jgi:ABC-type xylose transport system substrate-binding protein